MMYKGDTASSYWMGVATWRGEDVLASSLRSRLEAENNCHIGILNKEGIGWIWTCADGSLRKGACRVHKGAACMRC